MTIGSRRRDFDVDFDAGAARGVARGVDAWRGVDALRVAHSVGSGVDASARASAVAWFGDDDDVARVSTRFFRANVASTIDRW